MTEAERKVLEAKRDKVRLNADKPKTEKMKYFLKGEAAGLTWVLSEFEVDDAVSINEYIRIQESRSVMPPLYFHQESGTASLYNQASEDAGGERWQTFRFVRWATEGELLLLDIGDDSTKRVIARPCHDLCELILDDQPR
jgi:hypothetical protein